MLETETIVEAFEAVGTSRPVKFPDEERDRLLGIIDVWLRDADVDGLPEGIFELRNASVDDSDHRAAGP